MVDITKKTFDYELDFKKAVSELTQIDPRFSKIIGLVGFPRPRTVDTGFPALFRIIVGQQLSTAAANSIWYKLLEGGVTESSALLRSNDEFLRSLGLSRTKIQYAKGLADSNLDYSKLENQTNDDVINKLVTIKGIGKWTAEIYLMFGLQRIDIFAHGDLALQEAVKALLDLEFRPSPKQMAVISIKWKPLRTIAALILWKYYGYLKLNKG